MWKRITSVGQLGQTSLRAIQTPPQLPTPISQPTAVIGQIRDYRAIPNLQTPDKHKEYSNQQDFDRTVLNPEKAEGTRSGTDNEVAKSPSAYDPTKTSPESEMQATEEESEREGKLSNPLNVSGANTDVNKARDPQEGGPDHNANRDASSARGVTHKHRRVNTGGKQ